MSQQAKSGRPAVTVLMPVYNGERFVGGAIESVQVAFLRSHPEVALVGTQARVVDERGRALLRPGWRRATTDAAIRFQLIFDNAFIHSSVLFRREVVREGLGGYDEGFRTGQDFELWSRVAARHPVRNLTRGGARAL